MLTARHTGCKVIDVNTKVSLLANVGAWFG